MAPVENLGKKLKDLRKETRISQKELAARIGISPPNLSQWESMALPPLEGIMKICHELGMPLWKFFLSSEETAEDFLPPWFRPEHMEFIKKISRLPEELQDQLLKNFSEIAAVRKLI